MTNFVKKEGCIGKGDCWECLCSSCEFLLTEKCPDNSCEYCKYECTKCSEYKENFGLDK